jgi:hypothetical protein
LSAPQLEIAADLLGPILGEVVFVGGATVHLWLTDPGAPPPRATEDVDVICEVATRSTYYRLGERLRERGFSRGRGRAGPLPMAQRRAPPVLDDSGAEIRAATPILLVATKLCAWQGTRRRRSTSPSTLRTYVEDGLAELRGRRYFDYAIEGATAGYGSLGADRARLVRARLDALLS